MLILGLGKSGLAAARHALERGDSVTVYAGAATDTTRAHAEELEAAGATVLFDTEDVEGRYDTCVVSPGIPQTSAFYAKAAAASEEIISEPEYAWREDPRAWIAVTGTNGKTTTTSLTTHLLNESGIAARSCGNIGTTCLSAVEHRAKDEALVAEMSSFQLASTDRFAPQVAILLNITPDHIAWHGGFDSYAQAKLGVFRNMNASGTAVVTEEVLDAYPELADDLAKRGVSLVYVGGRHAMSCAYEDARGMLRFIDCDGSEHELVRSCDLSIKGTHNVENALAASAAALMFGCSVEGVRAGLLSFRPLEHRIEPCATVGGVAFYNDSKATNVDATIKALTAFPDTDVVLLVGGRDKGTDLSALVAACVKTCCAIIAYGEAGQRFYDAFASLELDCYLEDGMHDAFKRAVQIAAPGQAVVLSPACASLDQFDSFEHRGETFKEYVASVSGV